jgi:adenine-specific DNA-methyltransferase
MTAKTKLELTWIGKENRPRLEPRILLEDASYSHHAAHRREGDIFDNILIHGDNLLSLRSLEQNFAKKVKCIYIDPPYNTGQAFEYYNDGLEASVWLSLMRERLIYLERLLHPKGAIFVQIDDGYLAHLKLIMDEVFGPHRYINMVTLLAKTSSGASGGGEDRRLKKNTEFLLVYGGDEFKSFNPVYNETLLDTYLEQMRLDGTSFKYTSVLVERGKREYIDTIKDGSGGDIAIYRVNGAKTESLSSICKRQGIGMAEAISRNYEQVFTTENAQTSIRTRVQDRIGPEDGLFAIDYVPVSGRNKGKTTEVLFAGPQKRLVSWFKNVTHRQGNRIYKREKLGTLWDDLNWNNVTREGGVRFPNGQKPEKLISTCISLCTEPGDIVLDSFAGSGTTGAVAHKMKRRWIMIELGEHCESHIVPRLKSVIDGTDQGGVSKLEGWAGGGGYRYFRIAPSMLEKDQFGQWVISKAYNPEMLSEAMCKHFGFTYAPSAEHYWMQGHSSEADFIYVTTSSLTHDQLRAISEEVGEKRTLLICCKAFQSPNPDIFRNLTLRKIPAAVLNRCEWGKDDYSLKVENLPMMDEECADDAAQAELFAGATE